MTPFMSFLRSFRSPRGSALLQLLIGVALTSLFGVGAFVFLPTERVEALDQDAGVTDTVVVYGPKRFDATGSTANFMERVSFPRVAGRRYIVRLENGAADGSARVTSGTLQLNGWTLLPSGAFTSGTARADKIGAFRGSDTTAVTLTGAAGTYATMTVISVADPSITLFGPVQYTIVQGQSKDHDTTFTVAAPESGGPYTLEVLNGDSLGAHRTASATLTINGVQYLSPSDFNQNVGSVTTPVTLGASNFFHLRLPGEPEGFVVVRITGTDHTAPVLTITSPADGLVTRDTLLTVTGTVQDQTATQVTVNGILATLAGDGTWSASVPLLTEGSNSLAVTATDANGLHTDSTRTVVRDRTAPTLIVTTPAADAWTGDTSVLVTGSVTDASAVTANINGTPLALDSTGHFSTTEALTEGVNALVVTATDQVGNAVSVLRTLRRDSEAPVLAVATPATTVYTSDSTIVVSGTMTDASPTTLSVNGVAVPVDSLGQWTRVVALPSEGVNVATVTATDAAGHVSTVVRTIIRDTQAPTLVISAPASGTQTTSASITVGGTVNDSTPTTLTVNGTPVTPGVDGQWSLVVGLSEGVNPISATATDAAGNVTTATTSVYRDSQAPVITLTAPEDGATTTDSSITVSGSVTDASGADVTVNGTAVTVTGGAFSASTALVVGSNTITVTATDPLGNSSSVSRSVTRNQAGPVLPPDPSTVAPALDPTVATNTFASTSFLYTGANPIQTGVFPGTITLTRAAVVRGAVMSREGAPLGGVAVSLRGRPEYGQTLTRTDGQFDFALNGGGPMIFDFAKEGYLPSQRVITAEWQEWTVADTVALVPLDTAVTHISFTQPIEVARGSVVTDADGTRQGTLLFKQGTVATMVMPDGSTQPLSAGDVRVTEYTVGPNGKAAMPGELPATTAYTYAAELSFDQAIAAGAKSVTFSQPVNYFVDNFLNVPVGTVVPVGVYDRAAGLWRPELDGRVIKIVSITDGLADLSLLASDQVASQATLDSLGLTLADRTQLAQLYPVGKTLWWSSHTHFSAYDWNFAIWWAGHHLWPYLDPRRWPIFNCKDCNGTGSIIGITNQTLGEALPLPGTPYALQYSSDRTRGFAGERTFTIPAATMVDTAVYKAGRVQVRNEIPSGVMRVIYHVRIAGRTLTYGSYLAAHVPAVTVTWDGKDAAGRTVLGKQRADVRVEYWYPAVMAGSAGVGGSQGRSFGSGGGAQAVALGNNRASLEMATIQLFSVELNSSDARGEGFGGWTLNVHHSYNPVTGELLRGDGTRTNAQAIGARVRNLFTTRGHDTDMLVAPDGQVYFSHAFAFNHTVYRYDPETGARVRVAGDTAANFGFSGDGGPATSAKMNGTAAIALAPDGTLYISDQGNLRVRRVQDGIITTIAGNGTNTNTGDGGPAAAATIAGPNALALTPDGALYVVTNLNRIRRIGPDGMISTAIGNGVGGYPVDGAPATSPVSIKTGILAAGRDGSLYFSSVQPDQFNITNAIAVIMRVGPDGRIYRFAGRRPTESTTGLTPARQLVLSNFTGTGIGDLAVDAENRLLVTHAATVYRISQDGSYEIIAGIGRTRCAQVFGGTCDPLTVPNNFAAVTRPLDLSGFLAVHPDGRVLADDASGFIRAIEHPLPNLGPTEILVASEDGSEVYQFTQYGRHLRTLDALTRDTLIEFGYDSAGLVTSVTDADGLVTTFQRSGGILTGVTGPYGQYTTITQDGNGYLQTLTDPAGQTVTLTTSSTGLLTGLRRSGEGAHTFGFDLLGRLLTDRDPSGRVQTLTRVETDTSWTSSIIDDLGRTRTIRVDQLSAKSKRTTSTDAAGLVSTSIQFENDSSVAVGPDGTTMTTVMGSDTRFGPQAPVLKKATTRLPSGLTSTVTASRTAAMTNANDPFTLTSLLDSVSVNGRIFRNLYTRSTRTAVSTSPMGRTTTTIYDASGRVVESRVPGVENAFFQYDGQGRLQQARSGGRISTFAYDASGRLLSTTDPLGRKDSLFYDAADRLTRRRLPDGREVFFAYDSLGNLTSVTPPGRPAHVMSYDSAGRMVGYAPPAAGLPSSGTSYDYNTAKQVTAIHRPDGITVGFGYDTAGRPSTVSFDRGVIQFGYHPSTGNLTSLTAPGGNTLGFTYDGSLPTSVSWSGVVNGQTAVTYNNNFQVTGQTVNGANSVSYGYDLDGLLTQAGDLGLRRDVQNGRLVADSVGSQKTEYAYDSHGALFGLVSTRATDTLFVTGYERDSLGRITRLVEKVEGVAHEALFTYDTAGRLKTVTRDGALSATYAYDQNGNRLSRTTSGGTVSGVYDDQDRMSSYGGASYTYGANGELRTKVVGTDTTKYSYDALGNLTQVIQPDGTNIEYVIDAQNRRVGKKVNGVLTTGWLYQGQLTPVAELDGAGNVAARFVYATGINVPDYVVKGDSTYRLIRDHLGSVRLVVNVQSGTVVQRVDYDEFGVETQNTNPGFQPFGYAGGLSEAATGLVRFGARDYLPEAGRWTAKDRAGFAGGSSSFYTYVAGDPVNSTDPTGFRPIHVLDRLIEVTTPWGQDAVEYWAQQSINSCGAEKAFAELLGHLAALWTPDTAAKTLLTLEGAAVLNGVLANRALGLAFEEDLRQNLHELGYEVGVHIGVKGPLGIRFPDLEVTTDFATVRIEAKVNESRYLPRQREKDQYGDSVGGPNGERVVTFIVRNRRAQ